MTLKVDEEALNGGGGGATAVSVSHPKKGRGRRRCGIAALLLVLLTILVLVVVGVILGVTVLKVKDPKIDVVSATVEGVSPRVSLPAIKVELNVTLNLTVLIDNRNHASFKSGTGESVLLYQGSRVGDVELHPGLIPARGTTTLDCLLTLQLDRFAAGSEGVTSLISDIMDGQLGLDTNTRVPGRVKFLGIFRKHIVATSSCHIVIGFPDLHIISQDCKHHTKL